MLTGFRSTQPLRYISRTTLIKFLPVATSVNRARAFFLDKISLQQMPTLSNPYVDVPYSGPQLFTRWMTMSTGQTAIQWISVDTTDDAIHWIMSCTVDSVIHSLQLEVPSYLNITKYFIHRGTRLSHQHTPGSIPARVEFIVGCWLVLA